MKPKTGRIIIERQRGGEWQDTEWSEDFQGHPEDMPHTALKEMADLEARCGISSALRARCVPTQEMIDEGFEEVTVDQNHKDYAELLEQARQDESEYGRRVERAGKKGIGAMAKVSAYKPVSKQVSVSDISGAFEEFQSLRDEMTEWRDNMSSNNMDHLDKYQEVEAAADALDSFADSEPDVTEAAGELSFTYTEMVQRRKGRGTSRAVRCDNAVALLQGAVAAVEERLDAIETETRTLKHRIREYEQEAEDHDADVDERLTANPPDHDGAGDFQDQASDARASAAQCESDVESLEEESEALETLKDELENIISEAEGVEFPGMY